MRFIIRFIGLLALALGFIGIVIDGTRSMANAAVLFSSLAEVGNTLIPNCIDSLQTSITANGPSWLWDNICVYLVRLPASVVCFVLGALLLKLGQKKTPPEPVPGMPPLR